MWARAAGPLAPDQHRPESPFWTADPPKTDLPGRSSLGMLPTMAQPPGLEARVTALEAQVRELDERVRHNQQDAAAARVLAGGADRT